MDHNPDLIDDATKAKFQRMANRQTRIVMVGVIFGMIIGQSVSEAMAGESFWLRALAAGLSTGVAAGICAYLMENSGASESAPPVDCKCRLRDRTTSLVFQLCGRAVATT